MLVDPSLDLDSRVLPSTRIQPGYYEVRGGTIENSNVSTCTSLGDVSTSRVQKKRCPLPSPKARKGAVIVLVEVDYHVIGGVAL